LKGQRNKFRLGAAPLSWAGLLSKWQARSDKRRGNARFFGVVIAVMGGGLGAWYFGRLIPRRKRVESLLAEIDAEPG
jgi:hypothetical protein